MRERVCIFVVRGILALWVVSAGCSGDDPITALPGAQLAFETVGAIDTPQTFYDFPYPSDLRLTASGAPDLKGFPHNADKNAVPSILPLVAQRKGFSVLPVAYFRFDRPLAKQDDEHIYAARLDSPVLIIDVGDVEADRGKLHPAVALDLWNDPFVPDHLLAVAPWRGVLLQPERRYAAVVLRSLGDVDGQPLGSPLAFEQLKARQAPAGERGKKTVELYRPLWETLDKIGLDRREVAAATVFTTGDVVTALAKLSDALVEKYKVKIEGLALDTDDGDHTRYCELKGTVTLPQFQRGTSPFDTEGLFDIGADGLPTKQRDETVPVVITLPKLPMPAAGYPLTVYVHGSGGTTNELVDRGKVEVKGGVPRKGEGPAYVLAPFGIGMASVAKPVNPQRGGVGAFDYLNWDNLAAFRDTFRQGAIEERLFLAALSTLEIDKSALGACAAGAALPSGVQRYRFDTSKLVLMGHSMGGMYTNMVAAMEPKVKAAVPTGAGGFWSEMMLTSSRLGEPVIRLFVGSARRLTWLHPALSAIQTAWETADPIVFARRVARQPLPGHPVRHILEPASLDDSYFSTEIYDAMALSYGHPQAGQEIWPTMQVSLALQGFDGIVPYNVTQNLTSADGQTKYTGIVIQFEGDGLYDPHSVIFQLDALKHQVGCFIDTFLQTGTPVVVAPGKPGDPCK